METICPLCGERTPTEPDAEWVYCIHCYMRIAVDPVEVGDLVTEAPAKEQILEKLLRDCVCAIDALLMSPDLNLEGLEETTLNAIEVTRKALRAAQAALGKEEG
jgi:hypothetical protein